MSKLLLGIFTDVLADLTFELITDTDDYTVYSNNPAVTQCRQCIINNLELGTINVSDLNIEVNGEKLITITWK